MKITTSTSIVSRQRTSDDRQASGVSRVAEDIVAGGGVALLQARHALDQLPEKALGQAAGIKIVRRALEEPLRQMVANAGQDPSVVLARQ